MTNKKPKNKAEPKVAEKEDEDVIVNEAEEAVDSQPESDEKSIDSDEDKDTGDENELKQDTDAEKKDKSFEEKYIRLMADFQNYKKRTEKEKSDIYAYGNEGLMIKLLDVIDNFERAIELESQDKKYSQGIEMIFKQLKDVLEKAGLNEIEALGKEFDHNLHNAVMTEDNSEYESGQVSGVMQKGYTLNGKVIRPTMVKVNN